MIKKAHLPRRDFIKTAAAGGAALGLLGIENPAAAMVGSSSRDLRIERIIANIVKMKLGFTYSTGTREHASAIIWQVITPSHIGLGESGLALNKATPGNALEVSRLRQALSPWVTPLFGQDAGRLEALLTPLPDILNRDLLVTREGLSVALYDLVGKAFGLPVHTLLGGRRRNLVPGMPVIHVAPPDVMVRRACNWLAAGYRFLKIKFRGDIDLDVAAIRGIREAAGPDIPIQVDANAGYPNIDDAEKAIRALLPYNIYSFEDMLHATIDQLAQLRQRTGARIMVDRQAYWPFVYKVISGHAADVINHHPNNQGGLATALQIDAVATAAGLETSIGSSGLVGIQDAAFQSLSTVISLTRPCEDIGLIPYYSGPTKGEYDFDYEPSVIKNPYPIKDGIIYVPDLPGLGVELDHYKLEKMTVEKIEFNK